MAMLSARDAYRLWAPSYADETAISFLEAELAADLTPPLQGARLLDAGCGTGRRLHGTGASVSIGVDLCPEMLAAGAGGDFETLVADAGARLVVTDFHPAAHAAGHRRSFRHQGEVHEIEHHVHDLAGHLIAARSAGWRLTEKREALIGPEVLSFYEKAGRTALYTRHLRLPVVLGLAFVKEG